MSTGYKTEAPVMINIQPMAGATLATVEWSCEFWTTGRRVRVNKADAFEDSEKELTQNSAWGALAFVTIVVLTIYFGVTQDWIKL